MDGDGTGDDTGHVGRDGPPTPDSAQPPGKGHAAAGSVESEATEPGPEPVAPDSPAAVSAAESAVDEPGPGALAPMGAAETGPDGAGRSAVAAALLNLTGFGLGYAYLRCWFRAIACPVVAVLLVVVAFTNDAASTPWLWRILAALWVAATAVDAWWVARTGPRPQTRRQRLQPVAVGVVAVLAVVGGHLGYGAAGRATYAAGLEAQGRADCIAANRAFDLVTGPFELTLSRDVPAAAVRRAECAAFLAAEQAESAGNHAAAAAGYRDFRRDHPNSLLDGVARENVIRVLTAWAGELRESGELSGAIDRYRDLLGELDGDPRIAQAREDLAATYVDRAAVTRETMLAMAGSARVAALQMAMDDLLMVGQDLADTASAAEVPQAILDTFAQANNAVAEGRFCDALLVLDYAVTLPESTGVAAVAHADRARSLSECGLASFHAGDLTGAITRFQTLVAEYPNDPRVAQARSALIAAEVGRTASVPIPLPAPIDVSGSEPVVLYNAVSTEVRVLVTGPTAHEITLPGCPGCPRVYEEGESCPGAAGKPSTMIQLRPGTYHVLQDRAELRLDESVDQPITVRRGGGELCVTVTRE
jgi:Tetratricopeptide repeat